MNVVIVTSHDMGQHLGCYGINSVQTPNLDAMAAENVRFANSWCVAPQCSPSRSAIFTGRYPHSNGVMGLAQPGFGWGYHFDERHLCRILAGHGYRTALFGFQHETNSTEWIGFDEVSTPGRQPALSTADSFAEWVLTVQGPFYAEIAFVEPHRHFDMFGVEPDDEFGVTVPAYLIDEPSARTEFAGFQGMCKAVDAGYGRVVQAIKDAGLYGETMIIATTDHGIPFPRAKCAVYDPGLEVFSIWHVPGALTGAVVDDPISNVDYVPTILDLLSLDPEPNVQGRSFAPLLRGEPCPRRTEIFGEMTYHDYCDPRRAIRTDTHKLIVNFTTAPLFMDPSQTWRRGTITSSPADPTAAYHPPVELYDLIADPLEHHNLANDPVHASARQDLLRRLAAWMRDTQDPLLEGVPSSPLYHQAMIHLGCS